MSAKMAKRDDQNLIVALRVRPLSEEEIIQKATPIAHRVDDQMVVLLDPLEDRDDILRVNRSREKQFVFDLTFDGSASQQETYAKTCSFLIPSVINGYNATVFAYGATGTGKTHTMLGTDDDPGIMVRALNDLFLEMERTQDKLIYKVTMSYLEIYNEMIRDLLQPGSGYLELREDSKGVQVSGLSSVSASSTREVMDILFQGNKQRTQEPTAANKTSSRSHAVLQITVRQRSRVSNTVQEVKIGRLFLIDLAGSERAANTLNRGKRMVEGAHINRSLLALGNCINALSDKTGTRYINYRDSKLTRLLKDALGGNCKTVMIAHISPASFHFEESRNTLVYADRAKNIRTKVRQNVLDVSYHIAQYTNIITELRTEIKRLHSKLDQRVLASRNSSAIHAIQSEVLQVARREDETALSNLKEQLLAFFADQMELRRKLMEVNSTVMEISLETSRNNLFINRWERERALGLKKKESEEDISSEDEGREKGQEEMELEPEDVQRAREELQNLTLKKDRTEKLKANMLKELERAKEKALRIEAMLPKKFSNEDQQEVLSLLCRVHELEIENMQMQSDYVMRQLQLRKKDMVITTYHQHLNLCDEIISQQRALIDQSNIACSRDLVELYDLYQQGLTDSPHIESSTSLPDIYIHKTVSVTSLSRRLLDAEYLAESDRLSVIDEESPKVHLPNLFSKGVADVPKKAAVYHDENEDGLVFSQSPKSREIAASRAAEMPSAQQPLVPATSLNQKRRQQSIVTLSSHSNTTTPSPYHTDSVNHVMTSDENLHKKKMITSNTRHISQLAAQRRTKVQLDTQSTGLNETALNRTYASMHSTDNTHTDTDNALTESRLEEHDKRYGSPITMKQLLSEDIMSVSPTEMHSVHAADVMHPSKYAGQQSVYPSSDRKAVFLGPVTGSSVRTHVKRQSKSQTQTFGSTMRMPRTAQRTTTNYPGSTSNVTQGRGKNRTRLPAPTKGQGYSTRKRVQAAMLSTHHDEEQDDLAEFEQATMPATTIQQTAPERGKGLSLQKKFRGPFNSSSNSSNTSTPQTNGNKPGRKPPPSIQGYRRGNITVTGYSLRH